MKFLRTEIEGAPLAYYKLGGGPRLLLLLHGFPDDAATMLPLMERMASEEFTLIAPNLPGYTPRSHTSNTRYTIADHGARVLAMMDALGFDEAALFGHDWGAVSAYAAAQLRPDRVTHLCGASVPPLRTLLANIPRHPSQLFRSWYIFFFQLPSLPERALTSESLELIETLWSIWSPGWRWPEERLAKVTHTFKREETILAALAYYRGLLVDGLRDREQWRSSISLAMRRIECNTLVLAGKDDRCIAHAMYDRFDAAFTPRTPHRLIKLDGCGHFPQHEALDELERHLKRFLG
ncbi:unnamed protein product [Laminaria digitata]